MILYSNRKREIAGRFRDLFALGEIETAMLDAGKEGLGRAVVDAAHCYLGRWRDVPEVTFRGSVSIAEGFAFYGVYPEGYARAARRFFADSRARKVTVVGIRSIGTTLSAVVSAELETAGVDVERITVRPGGHPFDRRLKWTDQTKGWFLIVDEGPGMSGSSFCGTARALVEAGADEQKVVFLPSWNADGGTFVNEDSKRIWGRHKRYVAEYTPEMGGVDLSGGQWRARFGSWPAVNPQHERRKYLREGCIWKFCGLGHYGAAARALADQLEEFCPRVWGLENGFLAAEYVPGKNGEVSVEFVTRYLRHRAGLKSDGAGASFDELQEMIEVNCEEAGLAVPSCERYRSAIEAPVPVDGRMLPYEFIRTAKGYVKTDAIDHCRDHFFPGFQDIAWDVAGASVELGIPLERLCEGMGQRTLGVRCEFYRIAYAAYRLGYCTTSARTAGGADGARFRRLSGHYLAELSAAIWAARR